LIPVEISSKDSTRVKISKVMARCFLIIKVIDKFLVVLLVAFLSEDPKFLLYMFILTIFISLIVNLSGIFQNFLLLFLSLTTDIFTAIIVFKFYEIFCLSLAFSTDPSIKDKLM